MNAARNGFVVCTTDGTYEIVADTFNRADEFVAFYRNDNPERGWVHSIRADIIVRMFPASIPVEGEQ